MTNIRIIDGDITQVRADALITAINPTGPWWGGMDDAIMRSSGGMFHATPQMEKLPLKDGSVIFAPERGSHEGAFASVLFVVDALTLPLYKLVHGALLEAGRRELMRLSLPLIRTGNMDNVVELRREAIEALTQAVLDATSHSSYQFDEITISSFHKPRAHEYLLARFPNAI